MVISPSRQDPVAAETINRVALEAGFPKGVINMVHGGRNINKEILSHPSIKGVGFIGSNRAGWDLFHLCGKLGKTSSINGNGKNHVVIMPDADIDSAIPWLLRACFGMTGQRCLGVDNVVVIGNIYDEVKSKFKEAAAKMKLGYGLYPETNWGRIPPKTAGTRSFTGWTSPLPKGPKWCWTDVPLRSRIIRRDFPRTYHHRKREPGHGHGQGRSVRRRRGHYAGRQPGSGHRVDQHQDEPGTLGLHHDKSGKNARSSSGKSMWEMWE